MNRFVYKRYFILIIGFWSLIVIILFFYERGMLLNTGSFTDAVNEGYNERITEHIYSNVQVFFVMWLIGTVGIHFLYGRLKKQLAVTERTEKELIINIDKFKTVFDNAKDLMFLLEVKEGNNYVIKDLNKSAIEALGYQRDELIGVPIERIIDDATAQTRLDRLKKILKGEQLTFEAFKVKKDGTQFPVEASVKLVTIGNKKYIHSVERDITKRKIIEKELMAAKIKAEESDRFKSAFLVNMSHEIKIPMNGILGFSQLLQNNDLSQEKKLEYIGMINMSGKHLINLINNIIDISKFKADKMIVVERKFKLNVFIREIVQFFNSLSENDLEIKLKTALQDGQDVIKTDDIRLKQILTNLIGNSVKFTESGTINVSYKINDKSELLFTVSDTGIGMTDEEISVIFNRYRQADEKITRKYGGTGLGLAISKACVNLLGGNIWVKSEKDKGSSFYFTIPCKVFDMNVLN